MKRLLYVLCALVCLVAVCPQALPARDFNDKILNRPYADLRPWHLGFSVGMHTQNLLFTHNGYVTESGQEWQVEQPDYSPGFCVNGLFSLRLNNNFSLRLTPGMYFGNRDLRFRDVTTGEEQRQNVKSAFVVLPVDVVFSGNRYRNSRPFVVGGVMPAFDVAKKRSDLLKFKPSDVYLSVGFGCDFYLPYFKLVPELKFCFGLTDVLVKDRPDLVDQPEKLEFTRSLKKATSKMIILTFYFE